MRRPSDPSLFIAASALSAFAVGVAYLYLNFYFKALGLDDRAIGALNAAPGVGVVLAALPAFALADRYPRRLVILSGGALTFAAVVGVLLSSELLPLLVFAAAFGAGEIVAGSAGLAFLADETRGAGRTRLFGVWFAASGLTGFVAYALGGQLAAPVSFALGVPEGDVRALRALLALGAVVGGASGAPILLLRSRAVAAPTTAPRQWLMLGRFGAVDLCFGFGAGSFLPFLNLFFAERFRLDFGTVGLVVGAITVGGGLGALLHTRSAARVGDARSLVLTWSSSLPLVALGAFAPTALVAAVALVLRGVVMTAAYPTYEAFRLSSLRPRERLGAQAVLAMVWSGAHAAGAFVSGNVRAAVGEPGYTVNLLTLGAAYVGAIAMFGLFFRGHVPSGDAVESA